MIISSSVTTRPVCVSVLLLCPRASTPVHSEVLFLTFLVDRIFVAQSHKIISLLVTLSYRTSSECMNKIRMNKIQSPKGWSYSKLTFLTNIVQRTVRKLIERKSSLCYDSTIRCCCFMSMVAHKSDPQSVTIVISVNSTKCVRKTALL